MTERTIRDGNVTPFIGLLLLSSSPCAFLVLLVIHVGWEALVFPALAATTLIGWRMATTPVSGSAGVREREAGVPYVVQLDPDDPDAGLPRRDA